MSSPPLSRVFQSSSHQTRGLVGSPRHIQRYTISNMTDSRTSSSVPVMDGLDPHISSLISSNEKPSDTAIQQVKHLLIKPSQEISKIDAEIQRLQEALESLQTKRCEAQNQIDTFNIILSPARQIPPDILREIFFHCLPTSRNPIMSYSEAPLLLTHVSRMWRTTALTSPHIWARLHITFPGNIEHPVILIDDGEPMPETIDRDPGYVKVVQKRIYLANEWLSRSGSCPLSLSINCPSFNTIFDPWDTATQGLFSVVVSFADRWKELELAMPSDIYENLQKMLTKEMTPMLQSLRAIFFYRDHKSISRAGPQIPLLEVPSLTHLSLNAMGVAQNFSQMPPIWHRLTYLCFHFYFPDVGLLDLLKSCHNLVHCQLKVTYGWEVHMEPYASSGTAFLPHLKSFSLSDGGLSQVMTAVCRSIVAPSLEWVDYHKSSFESHADASEERIVPPLVPLVENAASSIKKLSIQPRNLYVSDVHKCLQLTSYLQHLILGQDPLGGYKDLIAPHNYPRSPMFPNDTFGVEALIVPESIESLDEESEILLPYLEKFEAYQASYISDKSLARFICSRLQRIRSLVDSENSELYPGSSSSSSPISLTSSSSSTATRTPRLINGIAVLRTVIVEFDREKQFDIKEEVMNAAKEAGVDDFKLELYYLSEKPGHLEPLSPSFGLTDDGRSWHYLEPMSGM